MIKKIFGAVFILALGLSLSACISPSEKAAEKVGESMAERALENATGGAADVDVDNGNVTVQTKEGSYEAGENVKLPDDFPSDVYVYEGKLLAVIKTAEANGVTVSIEADKPLAEVKAAYEEKLKADGWDLTGSMDFGTAASVVGKKGERSLSVMISANEEGKTGIVLTVAEDQGANQ